MSGRRFAALLLLVGGCDAEPEGYYAQCDPEDGGCGRGTFCVETSEVPETTDMRCLPACEGDEDCAFDDGCSACSDAGYCTRGEECP